MLKVYHTINGEVISRNHERDIETARGGMSEKNRENNQGYKINTIILSTDPVKIDWKTVKELLKGRLLKRA
ncbi:hypothetical protein [Anoxynatronum sibiricum]|uniref:Uncharacterized protein n=1 Tax=Anoxynatronum sibiricum TaxID=210623 RepID=A0ABU9VVX3_9CLOT